MRSHPSFQEGHIIRPSEIFDVVVTRPPGHGGWFSKRFQAVLIYGVDPMKRRVAAKGKMRHEAGAAVEGLLQTLADILGDSLTETRMAEPQRIGRHAVVDMALME